MTRLPIAVIGSASISSSLHLLLPISAFPATIPVKLDPQGRIDVDLDCPRCGYNLRMQRPGEGCPECGRKIDVEDRGAADELRLADAGWLRRVRRGARWLHTAVWLALLGVLPGLVLAAAGLWLLTTREPHKLETWFHRGTRLSARFAPMLSAVAGLAALGLLVWQYGATWRGLGDGGGGPIALNPILQTQRVLAPMMAGDWGTIDLLICTAAAAMAVGMLEAWRYLFRLAARADGPAVAQRCRKAWKQYLLAVGVVVLIALGTNLTEWADLRLPGRYYEYTAALLAGVITLVLLWVWWITRGVTAELVRVLKR